MKNLQKIYEKAYKEEWDKKKGTSNIRIVSNQGTPYENIYEEEGNFFLCGFVHLYFSLKGKNKELEKKLKEQEIETSKRYYGRGGLMFGFKKIGNQGNGDYLIQQYAYEKVCNYLNSLGYQVNVDSRLD